MLNTSISKEEYKMPNVQTSSILAQKAPIVLGGDTSAGGSGNGIGTTPPAPVSMTISKYQFRQLFTLSERIAIDNAASNPALTDAQKATLNTIYLDINAAGDIELGTPGVTMGIDYLVSIGLLTADRAVMILANLSPV